MVDEKDLEEKELNEKGKEQDEKLNKEPVEDGKEEHEETEKNKKESNELGSENPETKTQEDKNIDNNEKKGFKDLDPETKSSDENGLEDEKTPESGVEKESDGKTDYDFGEKGLDEDFNKESEGIDDLESEKEDLGDKNDKEPDEKDLGDSDSVKNDIPKDSMKEQEGPNKAIVYKEIGKYFSSMDKAKGNRLIASLGKENIRNVTDMVYDTHIGSFKKGEELEAAKEIYLQMALMGGAKTAIGKFENEGKIDNNKLVKLDPNEMDDEVKKSVNVAVTNPKETLEETKTAMCLRDKLMVAVGLDGNPLYGFLQGFMEEMEKDISDNLNLMNGPRTTVPKDVLLVAEKAYEEKLAEHEASLNSNKAKESIEKNEEMPQKNGEHGKIEEKSEDAVSSRESNNAIDEVPKEDRRNNGDLDKSKILDEALEDFDKYAKANGLNKENASKEVVNRVVEDAMDRTKEKLAEMADREYIEEKENMAEQHKHNQDR
ncbi:MAG: hypothetical protein IKN74_03800 [Clostridia bacterium]|nr:hypothetical protein [Clostridia bacterium]